MAKRDQLKARGLRAYELGRLRMAMRVTWVLLPAVAVCSAATGAGETCVCLGVLLLGAAVFLRWRDQNGVDSVRYGLLAGGVLLVVGLLLARVSEACAPGLTSYCGTACIALGVVPGLWLSRSLARRSTSISTVLAAMGIATLAASLGCVGLGSGGVAGAALGLLLGVAPTVGSKAYGA